MREYQDVDTLLSSDENLLAARWNVGCYVTFGTYPQTKAGTDKTAIEWQVLERSGDSALIISRYGLDYKPYNIGQTGITWESCTLRSWLNNEFYNKAFTGAEQAQIQTTIVDNSKSRHDTTGGSNTEDKIFLLSYAETDGYFPGDSEKDCELTDYALEQGGWTLPTDQERQGLSRIKQYWLRSPGYKQDSADTVSCDEDGCHYYFTSVSITEAVRPALWITIL